MTHDSEPDLESPLNEYVYTLDKNNEIVSGKSAHSEAREGCEFNGLQCGFFFVNCIAIEHRSLSETHCSFGESNDA